MKQQVDTLKDTAKEKAQAQLDTLNSLINLELSIWDKGSDNATWTTESSATDKEKWFFWKIWDRFSEKRQNFKNNDTKDKAKTIWSFVAWSLTTRWLFSLFSKEWRAKRRARREARREKRREKREARKAEKEKKREERKAEIAALPFRERPFWKILKWTIIWTVIVWWVYGIKRGLDKLGGDSIENKLWKIRWFESDCKSLKSQADDCLKLSRIVGTDYVKNKNEYDKILSDALSKQGEADKLFVELSKSRASDEIKKESENLKNNIDDYIDEIKTMKDEIYATVPDWNEWDNDNWEWDNDSWEWANNGWEWGNNSWEWGSQTPEWGDGSWEQSPEWEWAPEEFKPVSADVVSQAAIDYIDSEVKAFTLNAATKNKVKATLNRYFTSYPLLKKWKDNKMVFEISNKAEFWKTIKQLWDDIIPQLWWGMRNAAKLLFGNKLNNIDKTMSDLDAKPYEDVVFDYFWWVIRHAVKKEWWSMTVQSYYDGISKAYPNKNASQVASHISGQANKDIKDLKYPLT